MTKYIQTNGAGYVTGVVDEPILIGLFGGDIGRAVEITDEQAPGLAALLKSYQSRGEGLLLRDCAPSGEPRTQDLSADRE